MQKHSKHIIVLDVGTQSMRAVLFNRHGEIVTLSQESYDSIFEGQKVEQDPRNWKNALISTLSTVGTYIKNHNLDVEAISVTSQRASIIPVTKQNKVLYNAVMWQDRRSYVQCDQVKEKTSMKFLYDKTGLRLDSYFSAPKIKWLKENMRDVYNDAHKIIGVQDYITHLLTERFVTDHSQAARTMLMNIHTFEWDKELIEAFGLDASILPELVPPGSNVGNLTAFIHEKTGLPRTIKVILAGGDQQCAAVGLDVLSPGTLEANIGTGSFIIAYAEEPVFDENMRVICSASAVPGKWIVEAGLLTSGNIYEWYNKNFYPDEQKRENRFNAINSDVETAPAGANNLIMIPHFKGSAAPYWNPLSTGMFFNTTLEHTRGDFARSILEGIAYEMSENIELIEKLVGYVDIIHAAGGLTNFKTFNQIQSDVFNKAVSVYDSSEATALGALISALCESGDYSTHKEAFQSLRGESAKQTFHANTRNVATYLKLKRAKKHLYHAVNDAHIFEYMAQQSKR
ncbi:MAG: FGGY-family carbohydrate kinase [Bacillota bacterium]